MRKVTITKRMSDHEVKRKLRELARTKVSVEEGLDLLVDDLKEFEQKFGMSTVEFYRKFCAGKMGDDNDVIEWAGLYRGYIRLLQRLTKRKTAAR
jgi:hypothetical protein